MDMPVWGGDSIGGLTAAIATPIVAIAPPSDRCWTRVKKLTYTCAGTAHTLKLMRVLGRTITLGSTAAAQAVVTLAEEPGPTGNEIAAGDYIVFQNLDGTYEFRTVSSLVALALTVNSNFTKVLPAGSKVWFFGVAADTDPKIGAAHTSYAGVASAIVTVDDEVIGVCCSHERDEPILFFSANGTAAGVLNQFTWVHTPRGR